jgi:hypothetical protein
VERKAVAIWKFVFVSALLFGISIAIWPISIYLTRESVEKDLIEMGVFGASLILIVFALGFIVVAISLWLARRERESMDTIGSMFTRN